MAARKRAESNIASRQAAPRPAGRASWPSDVAAGTASDKFVVDYDPKCSENVDLYFLMWPCGVDKHGLGYATPALTADTHIAGHPIVDLWISSTTDDADVFVYLEDLAPEGAASIVTHGRLRASHRAEQPAPYRNFMGLPYHRGERRDAEPLIPGTPAKLRLDLLPTSTIIKAGHRLRLTVAGADPRQRSRNVKFDPPPTLTIHHDREHASQLTLPIVGAAGARRVRLLEIQVHRGQRFQALGDVLAHQPLRILDATVDDGFGDLAMAGVGVVDATGAVEGRDQQPVDGNAQPLQEHAE